jgi:putative membrane protein
MTDAARDELALIRTRLANERTALAYVRTSLAFLAAGAGLIHFIPSALSFLIGRGLIGAGLLTLLMGVIRYVMVRNRLNRAS